MNWLTKLGAASKNIMSIVAVLAFFLPLLFWILEPRIHEYIEERASIEIAGPCVTFPESGHFATDTAIGSWGDIYWNQLVKLRDDCGAPVVTGVIVNGGGFYHDSELSIRGVTVPVGTFDLKYKFFVKERLESGRGKFRVTVTYPNAVKGAPPIISPWVTFNILDPNLGID